MREYHPFVGRIFFLPILLFGSANASLFARFQRTSPHRGNINAEECSSNSPSDLAQEVLGRFQSELRRLPLVARRRSILNSTIDIRVRWQDDKNLVTYCEVPHVPILPNAFQSYFQSLSQEMPKADVTVKSIVELPEPNALKGILHAPFPCSNRLLLMWKHVSQPDPGEHLLVLNSSNNHQLIRKYRTPREEKSLVVAQALIAYWIRPVHRDGQVVGSQLHYLFQGDIGGQIPKWIQRTVGPRGAYDTVHGLLKHFDHPKQ